MAESIIQVLEWLPKPLANDQKQAAEWVYNSRHSLRPQKLHIQNSEVKRSRFLTRSSAAVRLRIPRLGSQRKPATKERPHRRILLKAFWLGFTLLLDILLGSRPGRAAEFPQAEISNGQIRARMYLPDARDGYYRSTRFDWSGAVNSLEYNGHNFYGPWYDSVDPKIINWVFRGTEIVSGPCSALMGPVDEFATPLGWDETKPGGTFIKLGVGVLRRGEGAYNRYVPCEVLDSGKWIVNRRPESVEFTQELSDTTSGYGYLYRKVVRLTKGKPEMVIEHSLKNTGQRGIQSSVYNHNFMVIDKQPPGPDFTFRLPFQIKTTRLPNRDLAEVEGKQIVYRKPLSGEDQVAVPITGFSDNAADTEIVIENQKVKAGVKVIGDRPLVRDVLWSIRTVLAIEPYIAIDVQPGEEFTWKNTLNYYTIPSAK